MRRTPDTSTTAEIRIARDRFDNLARYCEAHELVLLSEHACRAGHVCQGQHFIARIVIHGRHGEKQIQFFVGFYFVNPGAAVLADQVVAALQLPIGLQLLAVVRLFGDGFDEIGAGASGSNARAREISRGSLQSDYTGLLLSVPDSDIGRNVSGAAAPPLRALAESRSYLVGSILWRFRRNQGCANHPPFPSSVMNSWLRGSAYERKVTTLPYRLRVSDAAA